MRSNNTAMFVSQLSMLINFKFIHDFSDSKDLLSSMVMINLMNYHLNNKFRDCGFTFPATAQDACGFKFVPKLSSLLSDKLDLDKTPLIPECYSKKFDHLTTLLKEISLFCLSLTDEKSLSMITTFRSAGMHQRFLNESTFYQ
uniref:Uncharacterized protein n=1 Tax=Romanomermis culicivorax TaxID=13658 RepID=A0A915J1F6_ROMCU